MPFLRSRTARFIASILISLGFTSIVRAQVSWNGGSGSWISAGSWSGGVVPGGASAKFDVSIDKGKAVNSTVSVPNNSSYTIDSLGITAGDTLVIGSNGAFNCGSMIIDGTLSIGTGTTFSFPASGALVSGSGTILLNGGTITSMLDWLMFKSGSVGMNFLGSGTIGNLTNNQATIAASGASGATLSLEGNAALSSSGTIASAAGLTVNVNASLDNSGTINTNGGSINLNGSVTNASAGNFIFHGGTLSFSNAFSLTRDDEFTFSGGHLNFYSGLTTAGHTLTSDVDSFLYFSSLNNNGGTLNVGLNVTLGNTTNAGGRIVLGQYASGSAIANSTIDNSGGRFSVGGSGFTLSYGATLTGGTFESSNGGALTVTGQSLSAAATLADLTNNGTINLSGTANLVGTIDGSGTLNFLNGYQFFSVGTVTLGGTGTANLVRCSADAVIGSSGSVTIVNDVNHTITGYGSICSNSGGTTKTFINRGLMQAAGTGTGTALLTGGNHFINTATGTLRAMTGNTLYIGSDDFTSTGTIDIQAGGTLDLHSSNGGTASIALITNAGTVGLSQSSASIGSISGGTLLVNETNGFTLDGMNVTYFSSGGTVSLVAGAAKPAVKAKTFFAYALDVSDRGVVVDYDGTSPLASLTTKVKAGYASAGGRWAAAGNAIYSTNAAADPNHRAIGIAQLSALFGSNVPTTFLGQSVDATTVALRYTYAGDANLDGMVNVVDLGLLSSHWQQNGPWNAGDFNYDGKVDVVDLGILSSDWQYGTSGPGMSLAEAMKSVGFGGTSVPEPATIALLVPLLLRRHRAAYCCS